MNGIPRLRHDYAGPALFSYGFRPFFLFGALYAAVAMVGWICLLNDEIGLPTAFAPRDWHIHEMLFGFLAAVVTGFLLTAVPNWTGRLPLQGAPLLLLVVAWALGRIAMAFSTVIGSVAAAVIDASFLFLVAAAIAREIVTGRNWRNLKVLVPVMVLAIGNVEFHLEAHVYGIAEYGVRLSIAAIVMLIMLIGGRVIPSFTRNWLVRENPGRLPTPFTRFDALALAFSAAALVLWIGWPASRMTGFSLLAAGLLQSARLGRWAGERTLRDRLVLVLHVAYGFVPAGFLLAGAAAFSLIPASAGVHAWMAGAAGMMTLAVMTRASLGHTGRALTSSPGTQAIYATAFAAAVARVAASLMPSFAFPLVYVAGVAWVVAFGGFAALYGPILLRPRITSELGRA